MRTIIDADSISYLLGWGFKEWTQTPESYTKAIELTDQFVLGILAATGADEYIGFLGGVHPTFRHMMNREYKADRGMTKPDWWTQWGGLINHRLRNFWKFYYVEGIEAEDAVSMIAHSLKDPNGVTLAHIDKDLTQVPGIHYNYKDWTTYTVDANAGAHSLFKQVLMGDPTDNIPGLAGVGPKKATATLITGTTKEDFMVLALQKYTTYLGERQGILQFAENYAMVKLLDVCPPELSFDPANYPFHKCPGSEKTELFNSLISTKDESNDNSKYFVQQDTAQETQDKQIPN